MRLLYKQNNQEVKDQYFYIPDDNGAFVVPNEDVATIHQYVEEYDIIQKIQRNGEGFFDFSKNLIDIGAEDGNYGILLDFNHSYCFEPNKRACCLIYTNMYLRDKVDQVDVYNIGLDAHPGSIAFDGFNAVDGHSVAIKWNQLYEIQVVTLDSYNFDNVGLIKVDVEGLEERVLRGAISTIIRNNYPPILFECWNVGYYGMTQEKHDSLFNFIKSLGYEILEYWGDHETHLAVHKN